MVSHVVTLTQILLIGGISTAVIGAVRPLPNDVFNHSFNVSMKSYVVSGTIVTVPSDMTEQMRQDVLQAALYVQIVTDGNFSRNTQFDQWLDYLDEIRGYVGWESITIEMGDLAINESQFIPSDLALREMALHNATIGRKITYFKDIFNELKKRPDNDKAIKLLAKNAYDQNTHDTTLIFGSVAESLVDHNPVITILGISLRGVKDAASKSLFHQYKKEDVKSIVGLFAVFKQHEDDFAYVRKYVTKELGDSVKSEVCEIF